MDRIERKNKHGNYLIWICGDRSQERLQWVLTHTSAYGGMSFEEFQKTTQGMILGLYVPEDEALLFRLTFGPTA